jgi:hypothetical protein
LFYSGVGPAKTVKNIMNPATIMQIKLMVNNKYLKKPDSFSFVKIVRTTETNIKPIAKKEIHIFVIGSLVISSTSLFTFKRKSPGKL